MTLPLGSLINALMIMLGAGIGLLLGNRLPERVRESVFQGLGLCTIAIGFSMTLKTNNPLYMVGSILIGVLIGEGLALEERIVNAGELLKRSLRSSNQRFTEGFVAASLLFCVGSMAIIGPLNEGLNNDLSIILTKTLLDFFAAIAFGAVYGSGAMAAALPVLLYQGLITLFAESIRPHLTETIRLELEATGGVTIIGVGCNLLGITRLRLSNFLPALAVVVGLCLLVARLTRYL